MIRLITTLIAAIAMAGCSASVAQTPPAPDYTPEAYVKLDHPEWSKNAVLYQLNTRQFTREGTFQAAARQLPRLAEMGVDILWLMPIHPIGEVNRKGSLGSPYAVKDYRAVNPEFGTEADLKAFIDEAHRLGMKVILDWVANHSAWDNPLTISNPDWYSRTPEGDLMPPPGTDWYDVVDFDYSNPEMRQYMTESLLYWVREFDVDGYRADVAGFVPLDFWVTARRLLDAEKPVFMLAEWETRDLHAEAFDATYAWKWKEAMQRIAKEGGSGPIRTYYAELHRTWPADAYRMTYTDNHDQNSWDGVAAEIYGDAYEAAIALSFVGAGVPLIYNGQEADLAHQLEFFEKDEIVWREGRYAKLLKTLIALKHQEHALWNGNAGAAMIEVPTSERDAVFSFVRGQAGDRIFAIFNLTPEAQSFELSKARHAGRYDDVLNGEAAEFVGDDQITLGAWGYRIFREAN